MKLYGYWRSQAAFRVRVALNLKGLAVEDETIDLGKGEQYQPEYRAVNPQSVVPALFDGDGPPLTQSLAIMEYLEETHPEPALLPRSPRDRARVRALALIPIADTHPLMVPRIRNFIERDLKLGEAGRVKWISHWVALGLAALEANLAGHPQTGRFCHGDAPTFADICLAGQVIGAQNADCDIAPYPTVRRVFDACMALAAFASAHPRKRPDAPKAPAA